ncbi:MAG: dihydropteroate synthase [Acidimicrobiia bacterium]|nr:dihydropteroate synthase [Acidimicrobiia bacterium]NNC76040.1 dihydropteroate synthase [Acidimicrobiia bacterium]
MGVVNMTPDSFSDGGQLVTGDAVMVDAAVSHGLALVDAGCDIVDVGGESTRPGADPVDPAEELRRVVPVVRRLTESGAVVSVDTRHVDVAAAAIDAGAAIVNDVTALADADMATLVAESGVGVVLMHMRGVPQTMQENPSYGDVVAEIAAFLADRSDRAIAGGIDPGAICVDPGIGFGKTTDHNLEILRHIDRFALLGYPVLIGTSRKGFLGRILEDSGVEAPPPAGRDAATMATVALAIAHGASVVRVHDGAGAFQAARIADAIVRSRRR